MIDDIHGALVVVMDLEWIGNSNRPHTTHVVQLACRDIHTGQTFARNLTALAAGTGEARAAPATVYREWLDWIDAQGVDCPVYLVAHNGIRFDAPVLRNGMNTYGVPIPGRLHMTDSLHHIRYHSRCWAVKPPRYDIDSLCAHLGMQVLDERRHAAEYDVELLCEVLCAMTLTHGTPVISGVAHPVSQLSTMLVHGIGPVVYEALPCTNLVDMCAAIIAAGGDLGQDSCMKYLEAVQLKTRVPLCDLDTIAKNVMPAAERYLHYYAPSQNGPETYQITKPTPLGL